MSGLPDRTKNPFVFHDPAGRRWSRLRRGGVVLAVLLFIALVSFVQSLFVTPELRLPSQVRKLKGQIKAIQQQQLASSPRETKTAPEWLNFGKTRSGEEHLAKLREQLHSTGSAPAAVNQIRAAFFVDWDPNCLASLERHASSLTHVCPEWGSFADMEGNLTVNDNPKLQRVVASHGLVLIPILSNQAAHQWQPEAVESLANGPAERRDHFILQLLNALQQAKAGGVLLDWEQVDPTYQASLSALIEQIAKALHSVDKQLWFTVPMGEDITTFDIKRLSPSVDHFVAMLTDQNSDDDKPGPIASQDWFESWLDAIGNYGGDSHKWVAALGTYGYDWTRGRKKAELISFRDAMTRASYAGLEKIEVGAPDYNPFFSYQDTNGNHSVCFLDAITFLNQLRSVVEADFGGIAIERLGTEDPHLWEVLSMRNVEDPSPVVITHLTKLQTADEVTNVGEGELVTVDDTRDDGYRSVKLDKDEQFEETYSNDFPTYPVVYHEGAGDEHAVTLSFDDGPDPTWTPKILDILKERHVKAVFFLIGSQAEQYPRLVKRIVDEGHEIGNHTYTHPNVSTISEKQLEIELNATQFLLESITGRSTTLCRPPYDADTRPENTSELKALKVIQDKLGYLIVMEGIDPEDWSKPGASEIVRRIREDRQNGNIILLHDAGGNRGQTVEALPKIIDFLQMRGDHIVSLSELLHIPRDDLMPPTRQNQKLVRVITSAGFSIWHAVEETLWAFMISATGLIVIRGILVAVLAAQHHRQHDQLSGFYPALTVIVAAYNEGKVIRATLESLLDTDYPGEMELIVVDDGSSDDTAAIVEEIAAADPRVRLIRQANGGKSTALRRAVAEAGHEILVFLDADTRFERGTITHLVQALADKTVGAVSGHARVGNMRTFLARCQALEYTCGFNLDRRAYATWNCITVAPGAISALRREALEKAGGFTLDTLAEDTDLTLSMHQAGYKIAYADDAVAWTEAPETISSLAKQRFRWAFGTLQCLWKHRDLVFNPDYKALGWFALPSIWFCQILLVAITPIVDVLLIFSLLTGNAGAMGLFFVTFLAMDMALALAACKMDDEPLWKAWRILPMRLIYRPLLSWVVWRSILKAAKGAWVTWGKLERTASVEVGVT